MTIGPGKYDDICTQIREQLGIADTGGGIALMIIGGNRGDGFSIQADLETTFAMPALLLQVAMKMQSDLQGEGKPS